jgi:hypothetical protein
VLADALQRLDRPDPWEGITPQDLTPVAPVVDEALAEAGIELEPFDRFRS